MSSVDTRRTNEMDEEDYDYEDDYVYDEEDEAIWRDEDRVSDARERFQ